jgi:hypothetical protein
MKKFLKDRLSNQCMIFKYFLNLDVRLGDITVAGAEKLLLPKGNYGDDNRSYKIRWRRNRMR